MPRLVEYEEAGPEVRAVYDEYRAWRGCEITPYWKAIAVHPPSLVRAWSEFKTVMADGALDKRTKEMVYLAVSITNRCDYCVDAHTAMARELGMSEAMRGELVAVVALANGLNNYAIAYQVPPAGQASAEPPKPRR